jgi:hypothetical protein
MSAAAQISLAVVDNGKVRRQSAGAVVELHQDGDCRLGLLGGTATFGTHVVGHTGKGPGSVIAVYHAVEQGQTAAAFTTGDDPAWVEHAAFAG